MTFKTKVAIGTDINGHAVYPTTEFLREMSATNVSTLTTQIAVLQSNVASLTSQLADLNDRVSALTP